MHRILDEALICHLGYLDGAAPVVLPTTHARLGDTLYLHGSTGSGPMRAAGPAGLPVCVTASLVDALVLARSALHHSLSYRSVIAHGTARLVCDPDEKRTALAALLDHIAAGRSAECRAPNERELAATAVLALELREVSAKVRSGAPEDDPDDLGLPYWAGVVPLHLTAGDPEPADDLKPTISTPRSLSGYHRGAR